MHFHLQTLALVLVLCECGFSTLSLKLPSANLIISPQNASIDQRVRIDCIFPVHVMEAAKYSSESVVEIRLYGTRTRSQIARQDATCGRLNSASANITHRTGQILIPPRNCSSMVIYDLVATQALEGAYVCDVAFTARGLKYHYTSKEVSLRVSGDPSPPVTRFSVINAATGVPVERGSQVSAGVRLSVMCESVPLKNPPSAISVSVSGGGVYASHTPCARIEFYVTVPREPQMNLTCRSYNGYGAPQIDEMSLTPVYGPGTSEITTLQDASTKADDEFVLCFVRNNPSRRLKITVLEPDVLQTGYPRFAEHNGLSLAFAKFHPDAIRADGRLVTFKCWAEGLEPVMGAVRLTGPLCESCEL